MTALAGYWSFEGRPDTREQCARMLRAQQVYGPQPPMIASQAPLALGCRMFHTMADGFAESDSGALLVADLRLDNRAELREQLELPALPDAALVLRALDRWGDRAVDRIQGDFAIAWWDPRHRRLLLARDCLGQKPLHYSAGNGFFAFASMAKGLHALEEVPVEPDLEAAAAFVALIPESGSETFFRGVEKVRAGHFVTITPDGIRSERWWQPSVTVSAGRSSDDYAEGLRHHFDRAVSDRLEEGAVGSHLSAGLDSGCVTATAAGLLAASGRRLTAFTAVPRQGYDGPAHPGTIIDEGPMAAELAAMHANIDHVIVRNGGSPLADLDRNFFLYERPVLNLCNMLWAHRILDEARARKIGVLLTGQYGNMSISYSGMPLLHQLLARGRWLRLAREAVALRRNGAHLRLIASQALGPLLPKPLWTALNAARGRGFNLADYSAIAPEAVERMQLRRRAAERGFDMSHRPRRDPAEERLWVLHRVDLGNYNKGTLAGWGIDQRDPTADRRLIEFCLSVPMDQYLRAGVTRALARTAFADRLPPSVRDEERRGHQGADWHEGVAEAQSSGALAAELRSIGGSVEAASVVDVARMLGFEASLPVSDWHKPTVVWPYRLALLRGVSAGHFIRRAKGSNA